MKYDESDNPVVRVSRALTDKLSDVFSGMFTKSELSEALTEICKIDPDFDKSAFLKECEAVIIPNILEAMVRGELEILQDWCHESVGNQFNYYTFVLIFCSFQVYSRLRVPIEEARKHNYMFDSKILDVSHVDVSLESKQSTGITFFIFTARNGKDYGTRSCTNNYVSNAANHGVKRFERKYYRRRPGKRLTSPKDLVYELDYFYHSGQSHTFQLCLVFMQRSGGTRPQGSMAAVGPFCE